MLPIVHYMCSATSMNMLTSSLASRKCILCQTNNKSFDTVKEGSNCALIPVKLMVFESVARQFEEFFVRYQTDQSMVPCQDLDVLLLGMCQRFSYKNCEIFPQGYRNNDIRRDQNRPAGGVFITAKDDINITEIEVANTDCPLY